MQEDPREMIKELDGVLSRLSLATTDEARIPLFARAGYLVARLAVSLGVDPDELARTHHKHDGGPAA